MGLCPHSAISSRVARNAEAKAAACSEVISWSRDPLITWTGLVNSLAFSVKDKEKTIYSNFIPLDSAIEENFARDCESRDDIEFYFKLPFWFKISTPIGKYNPDWALIFKNEKRIYFVAETKSTTDLSKLRNEERLKVKCGKAHFNEFEDIEYKHVKSVVDLH